MRRYEKRPSVWAVYRVCIIQVYCHSITYCQCQNSYVNSPLPPLKGTANIHIALLNREMLKLSQPFDLASFFTAFASIWVWAGVLKTEGENLTPPSGRVPMLRWARPEQ